MNFIFGDTVDFTQLTWEAVVAFVAVIAAFFVGLRQADIQKRQAQIADVQARATLWQARLDVYDATRAYLSYIALKGAVPGRQTAAASMTHGALTAPEIGEAFNTALDRSQFLFQRNVHAELRTIAEEADQLATLRASPDIFYEPTKGPMESKAAALRQLLVERHKNVAAIFGDELKLSASQLEQRER
ncbi:hypothetical protein [Brevundimonas sp.]|uniref:hypothetical protein n=1 Tax=Brevundimonas sp. TaxID=1871086 RepID=UPI0028AA417C|nr:hypothetical protein [Brevundimonas sp.]